MSPPVMRPPNVVVENLTKRYDDTTAVDGISFELAPASVTALLGGNGAGKTTTISMMLGLITPTSGSIQVFGANMLTERHKVLHRMNFESPYVDMPMRLTVRQNLTVFGNLYGLIDLSDRIDNLARELRLTDLLDRPTGKLSAGQKTRVSLAKSLLNAPDLLLLDEPTASLDPDTADWVREKLEHYCSLKQASMVLASHNMAEVERMADRVIMLESGCIVADGKPSELIAEYGHRDLEGVFLEIARRGEQS